MYAILLCIFIHSFNTDKIPTVQGALQWLEDNQDKTIEEITATTSESAETDPTIEPEALKDGEVAKSMVCNICGKKFRSMAQAEFHASKT
jgi:UBX domain-containing protein 1/4